MVMLLRAIVVMAGRCRPLMQDDGNRYSLGTLRDTGDLGLGVGLDLGLGLRRGSRSAGRAGAGACRRGAHKAGERQHHHSHK